MERLAYAITDFLLRRGVIKEEESEIYVYGYAVVLEQLAQVLGFIILAVISGTILETALFLLFFHLFRSCFGGYHADTSLLCLLVSYSGWMGVMVLSKYLSTETQVPVVLWVILVLDACVFAKLGPVAHANKPLTAEQRRRNKRNGFVLLGVCSLLAFLGRSCVFAGTVYIGTITFVAVLAILGKRKVGTKYEED